MGSNVITLTRFGDVIKPIVGRWKKQASEQIDSYYEILKFSDEELLAKAARHLMERAVHFPTPGEIKDTMREIYSREYREGKTLFGMRPSCMKCRNGNVKYSYDFTRGCDGRSFKRYESRPCAICNQEPSPLPHYVQVGDAIYFAARLLPGSKYMWVPDMSAKEIRLEYTPCYETKVLEEYYEQEKSGKVVRTEPPKQILDKIKKVWQGAVQYDPDEAL